MVAFVLCCLSYFICSWSPPPPPPTPSVLGNSTRITCIREKPNFASGTRPQTLELFPLQLYVTVTESVLGASIKVWLVLLPQKWTAERIMGHFLTHSWGLELYKNYKSGSSHSKHNLYQIFPPLCSHFKGLHTAIIRLNNGWQAWPLCHLHPKCTF